MVDWWDLTLRLVVVLVAFLVLPLLVGQTEHKAMAHMQARVGPMYAGGFHGWAQLVADGVKFVQKEDVDPGRRRPDGLPARPGRRADARTSSCWSRSRSRPTRPARSLDPSLFFVLAVMSVGVLGSLMAGWASANKFSLLGGLRVAAQLMAYELPFVLAAASAAMAAGTAVARRDRRGVDAVVAAVAAARRWSSSSWPAWPSCSGRRSTCRSPTPRSSSAPTPSTPASGSRCSCSPSTPASSSSPRSPRCCSSAAGTAVRRTSSAGSGRC